MAWTTRHIGWVYDSSIAVLRLYQASEKSNWTFLLFAGELEIVLAGGGYETASQTGGLDGPVSPGLSLDSEVSSGVFWHNKGF